MHLKGSVDDDSWRLDPCVAEGESDEITRRPSILAEPRARCTKSQALCKQSS